ncbi:hypothetical protein M9458_041210, partial [Cirrhinus mrigala]
AWRAPYSARTRPTSSALATLDAGAAKGYAGVPQVERAVAVHLCPQDAATWQGSPRLPSKACRLSSALTGRAYSAAGQAATALHTMATLQVYQAKALKELHRGSPDQAVLQELRAATDFTLRATKVMARSLGQVMSTLVVQERHLWLNLAQMADVDKARFLDAPVSQAGLFGDTFGDFAQQFSAVQKQTEAISHILPRRETPRSLLVAEGAPLRPPRSKNNLLRLRLSPIIRALPPDVVALSPRVFTKVAEGALNPLWRKGIRILNYLDDWLIMAHSRDLLCEHRDLVLQHLSHLGLQVNREKSKLSPVQRISFLGMELDSVNMTACLTNERTQSVLSCLKSFRHKTAVPLKTFQRLLGHMAAAAAVMPLGLLHMRPLQRCLQIESRDWHGIVAHSGLAFPRSVAAYSARSQTLLSYGPEHVVVHTDASTTGWGAVCNGQAASGFWTGPRLLWHINCLELLAVLLALRRFLPMLRHKHVLVRTDNTATVAYINRQGGLRSRRMSQLARHLLLWSQTRLKSLRAVHIPGELNRAADQLSRQPTHPGEWRLHPQTVQLIWSRFGEAQIDLFASPESSHCQLYYSLGEAPLGRDALAHSWPPGPNLLAQSLCKIREDGEQVLLVAPFWPTRTCPSLEDPLEEGPSFSGDGHNLSPASRSMEPTRVASGRDT